MRPRGTGGAARRGFTLIEVLLATLILSVALSMILTGSSRCLTVMRRSGEYQRAQWALNRGMLEHPILFTEKIEEQDVEGEDYEGYVFSRKIEDDEDEDGLYVVRTRVTWPSGGREMNEEIVEEVYQKPEGVGK
jgi:prepilin-type N-terminal cleavage/methylation domain-containing protein